MTSDGVGVRLAFRHGAVLVRKNRVVAVGYNSYKTHPLLAERTEFPYLHAETHAIFRYGMDNCEGLDLYVARINREGELQNSAPCLVCRTVIRDVGIANVYHSL